MSKETYYFTHDYNARNDDKILELRSTFGAEGYGVFWMIIESMAENENGGVKATLIGGLSLGYGVAKDRLLEIITFCISIGLLYEEEGVYFSKRMLTHKQMRKSLSESGAEGAKKRWGGHREAIAPPMQRKGKEKKGKEIINTDEFNWESDKSSFFNAGNWIFKFCTDKSISTEDFDSLSKEFISDLELREDFKPLKEIRNHFTNWYNNRKANGKKVAVVAELSDYQKGFQKQRDDYKNKFK